MSENFNYRLEKHPETDEYLVRSEGGERIATFKLVGFPVWSADGEDRKAVAAHEIASRMADVYRRMT